MESFIVVVHVLMCFFMIGVVLLQAGKSDMGSAFGGAGSQATLGPAASTSILGKITAGAAVMFMVTSMSLAWFSNASIRGESVIQGDVLDELDDIDKEAADVAPPVEAPEPAIDDAGSEEPPANQAVEPVPAGD